MSHRRKVLFGLAVVAIALLVCMPVIVDKPRPFFEQSISGLSTDAFPIFAALGILVLSLAELARRDAREAGAGLDAAVRTSVLSILVPLTLIVLAAAVWEHLGYLATSVLVAASLSLWMGNRNLVSILVISVIFPASIYWLVTRVLSTHLPAGRVLHDFLS